MPSATSLYNMNQVSWNLDWTSLRNLLIFYSDIFGHIKKFPLVQIVLLKEQIGFCWLSNKCWTTFDFFSQNILKINLTFFLLVSGISDMLRIQFKPGFRNWVLTKKICQRYNKPATRCKTNWHYFGIQSRIFSQCTMC